MGKPKRWKHDADHERRIAWWRKARYGMFVHWGVYAVPGRGEWQLNVEQIPHAEYETHARRFRPRPRAARQWARLAKQAGMKHMVMTAKHHDGFCLWDSQLTDYNAAKLGPQRDLVAEYVDAAREFGLKAGLYYSLMDWHHPDGAKCALNQAAYKRFIDFTHGCVRELMTHYGKLDILWYDLAWPFMKSGEWQSKRLNRMVRKCQPDILINDRSLEPEDFDTGSEGHVKAGLPVGRDWEACMTTTGCWGYRKDFRGTAISVARETLSRFHTVSSAGGGNLLLNVGPDARGDVPKAVTDGLRKAGRWLAACGEAFYKGTTRHTLRGNCSDGWTVDGKTGYLWCNTWGEPQKHLGRMRGKVLSCTLLPGGKRLKFRQTANHLAIGPLPKANPEKAVGVPVIKVKFASQPRQDFGIGYVILPFEKKKT